MPQALVVERAQSKCIKLPAMGMRWGCESKWLCPIVSSVVGNFGQLRAHERSLNLGLSNPSFNYLSNKELWGVEGI